MAGSSDTLRRARRTFWLLALVGVFAAGSLSAAIQAPAGTLTGILVALSGLVLITAVALAARVMVVLERARRRAVRGSRSRE